MSTGILVAVGATEFESEVLVAASAGDLHVVRRCVDVADLLATAASRQADVALMSTALGGLDADVVARLGEERVTLVGVVAESPSTDATVLRSYGIDIVVATSELSHLETLVAEARESQPGAASKLDGDDAPGLVDGEAEPPARLGKVVAVWGATGAPGRSVVSLGLASYVSALGLSTMLVDADVYGGSQSQLLGLLDESSGLLAAARAANAGRLDRTRLADHARSLDSGLRVLTGLPRSDRWVELSPVLLRRILETARSLSEVTVVDCAFCIELDEEISYDTAAPRRNGATLAALENADVIVVVGSADPVGLGRLLRALADLAVRVPDAATRVVVNRMRSSLGWSGDDVSGIIRRTSHAEVFAFLPDDPGACDRALVHGQSLLEAAHGSKLGKGLLQAARSLAADLGLGAADEEHRLRRRRSAPVR